MGTPAVFCAPAISARSTPCISTPAVFQHESYPWAVKTPEASPMCWGVAPPPGSRLSQEMPVEPLISRELLRKVCEPFFEQMLTALQQALQQSQMHQCDKEAQIMRTMSETTKSASFQSLFCPTSYQTSRLEPMLDEESTEADDLGAFASLLSGPSSEGESIDAIEAKSPQTDVVDPLAPSCASNEDSEQTSEPEKSTMVCRHWKSKGWCRLEHNCKFLHPEHKRGVAAPKGCTGSSTNGGGISRATHPGMSTILSLSDAISVDGRVPSEPVARRKKRAGRDKCNQEQQLILGTLEQEVSGPQSQGHSGEHTISCSPCTSIV